MDHKHKDTPHNATAPAEKKILGGSTKDSCPSHDHTVPPHVAKQTC